MKTKLTGQTLKKYEDHAIIFKAMAHSTRLFILEQLKRESLCVCEINEIIDAIFQRYQNIYPYLKRGLLVWFPLQ